MDERPRILVVDDEAHIRRSMQLMLRREFNVTTAESGFEVIDLIHQRGDFAVVSLDLRMPGISGIEVLREIKQLCPAIQVLIITGYADVESAKKAVKLGAYDYLDKPIEKESLRAAIRRGVELYYQTTIHKSAQEELSLVKAQLVHSEKLAAIGELLAGVAHELSSPITGMLGYSELLLSMDLPSEKIKLVERLHEAALLCERVVQRLLPFVRKDAPQRELMDVTVAIEGALSLKTHQLKSDEIRVLTHLSPDLPAILADPYQLEQVFLNLLNNAHQSMEAQERERILTIQTEHDGERIRVSFCDTGCGIPQEHLQKIFEPFFTTKQKGTGLGLSISYEIIKEHAGSIYVASEIGEGTRFVIELPVVEKPTP